eukprot:m.240167 g.240167  ORF g.240167 m.240167 type:complete len:67 (+) comp15300_c1_seq1:406-606(+)
MQRVSLLHFSIDFPLIPLTLIPFTFFSSSQFDIDFTHAAWIASCVLIVLLFFFFFFLFLVSSSLPS